MPSLHLWKKALGVLVYSTFALPQRVSFMAKAGKDAPAQELQPQCFKEVSGFEDRKNDIIFYRKDPCSPIASRVVYFGGDIQDYPENMLSHRDNKRFEQWNLLNTAVILGHHFPKSEIYIVKPVRMQIKTFCCFDNFVIANEIGAPDHVPDYSAIKHMALLLDNAYMLAASYNHSKTTDPALKHSSQNVIPVVLVGFSKGCVVLNQFLYELNLQNVDSDVKRFVKTVSDMYWLDGGHPGGSNTWVTKKEILQRLADTGIHVHVFVTPYQIGDHNRPWLKREEKIFSSTLSKMNAKINRDVMYGDKPGDINLHFQLLKDFKAYPA